MTSLNAIAKEGTQGGAPEPRGGRLLRGLRSFQADLKANETGDVLTRVALLFAGFLLTQVAVVASYRLPLVANPWLVPFVLLAYAIAIALVVTALFRGKRHSRLGYVVLMAIIYALILSFATTVAAEPNYATDSIAYSHYSATVLIEGRNPYAEDMGPSLTRFGVPPNAWSPLESGGFFQRSPYPSGSFLVLAPFVAAGMADVRWIYLATHLLGLVLLFQTAPREFRALAPLGLAWTPELIQYTSTGAGDIFWVVPLILCALSLQSPTRAGLWYGLASAMKQLPWFLGPFLLIWIWRSRQEEKMKSVAWFSGTALLVFLLFNGPFLVWDAGAWFAGVFGTGSARLTPVGIGLSALTQYGVIALPRSLYIGAEFGVLGALLVAFHLYFDRLRYSFWVFPAIVLFVGYRTLQSYVVYWAPFALAGLWMAWEDRRAAQKS